MNKKSIYEWVVVSSRGEDLYLTENQYQVYKESRENGVVSFADFEINPSFVVKAYKREAQIINIKYKCEECNGNGHTLGDLGTDPFGWPECPICKGTGVDLRT